MLVNLLGSHANEPYVTIGAMTDLNRAIPSWPALMGLFQQCRTRLAIAMNAPRQASEMPIKKHGKVGVADNCTLAIVKLGTPPELLKNYQVQKIRDAVSVSDT